VKNKKIKNMVRELSIIKVGL